VVLLIQLNRLDWILCSVDFWNWPFFPKETDTDCHLHTRHKQIIGCPCTPYTYPYIHIRKRVLILSISCFGWIWTQGSVAMGCGALTLWVSDCVKWLWQDMTHIYIWFNLDQCYKSTFNKYLTFTLISSILLQLMLHYAAIRISFPSNRTAQMIFICHQIILPLQIYASVCSL
jgi:hypothetical protein